MARGTLFSSYVLDTVSCGMADIFCDIILNLPIVYQPAYDLSPHNRSDASELQQEFFLQTCPMGQEPSNIIWLLLCHLELQILNEGARIRILIRKLGPGMAAHDYRLQSTYYPAPPPIHPSPPPFNNFSDGQTLQSVNNVN